MKKLFCFLAVAGSALFTSCSSDDDNGTGDGGNTVTEITLSSNINTVVLGEGSFTFTVADQDGNDLTSSSEILVNDVAIEGSTWEPTEAGTFTVEATYENLTSDVVTVTVTEATVTPENSFVIDGVNYETPTALFGYRGISETAEGSGEYFIAWDFNPFLQEGTAEAPTYPNDFYITVGYPIEPTGEENGQPTFTIVAPAEGTFTYTSETLPSVFDTYIINNNSELLPEDAAERAELIEEVTLNINSLVLAQNEDETTTLSATYTVTLTNGTVIEGQFSGDSGFYGLPQGRNSNISFGNVKNTSAKQSIK